VREGIDFGVFNVAHFVLAGKSLHLHKEGARIAFIDPLEYTKRRLWD
jgi:hypothetical protein